MESLTPGPELENSQGQSLPRRRALAPTDVRYASSSDNDQIADVPKIDAMYAFTTSLADPKVKARFANVGSVPKAMTPAEFGRFVAEDTAKWGKAIRAANIKLG